MKQIMCLIIIIVLTGLSGCSSDESDNFNISDDSNGDPNINDDSNGDLKPTFTFEFNFNEGIVDNKVTEFTENFSQSVYSDDVSYDGSLVLKTGIKKDSKGFGSLGAIYSFPTELEEGDEFWIRFRQYMPADWTIMAGNRMKWIRLRTFANTTGASEGYNDVYLAPHHESSPFTYIGEFQQSWYNLGELKDTIVRDTWETYEIYYKFNHVPSSEGGEAILRFWKNGKLLNEMTERKTLNSANSVIKSLYFLTYYSNDGAPQDQYLYFDDIVFTTKRPLNQDEDGNYYIGE